MRASSTTRCVLRSRTDYGLTWVVVFGTREQGGVPSPSMTATAIELWRRGD